MHVDGALLDVDVVAPDLIEQLRSAEARSAWVMKKCSSRYWVGATSMGLPLALTRWLMLSMRSPAISISSVTSSGLLRPSTAWMRATISRGENGLEISRRRRCSAP